MGRNSCELRLHALSFFFFFPLFLLLDLHEVKARGASYVITGTEAPPVCWLKWEELKQLVSDRAWPDA